MQAIIKGLEKLNQELTASESDGPVSEVFRKVCCLFLSFPFAYFINHELEISSMIVPHN